MRNGCQRRAFYHFYRDRSRRGHHRRIRGSLRRTDLRISYTQMRMDLNAMLLMTLMFMTSVGVLVVGAMIAEFLIRCVIISP